MIYLASPYTSNDPLIEAERALKVTRKTAQLMSMGMPVYSPIVYTRNVLAYIDESLDTQAFWLEHCLDILKQCSIMFVYKLDGWNTSNGVAREINLCKRMGIPIVYLYE